MNQCLNLGYVVALSTGTLFASEAGKSIKVLYDVAVDLRKGSPTYCKWFGVELTEENKKLFDTGRICPWLCSFVRRSCVSV